MITKNKIEDFTEDTLIPVFERLANGLEFFAMAILTSGRNRRVTSSRPKVDHAHNVTVLCASPSKKANGISEVRRRIIESYCVRPEEQKSRDRLSAIAIRREQIMTITEWVDHLHSSETDVDYSENFKRLVLETVIDSTQRNFNGVEEIRFRKRNSLQKFPELNTFALNSVYEEYLKLKGHKLDFATLYGNALTEVNKLLD